MASITYECSNCGAILQSPQAIPAGKKIRCSKCHEVFAVGEGPAGNRPPPPPKPVAASKAKPAPAPDDDEDGSVTYGLAHMEVVIAPTDAELSGKRKSDDDEDEDDDFDDDKPVKKKKKRFKERKQSSGSGKTVALILVGVLLLLLLAGGGTGAYLYLNWYKNKGTGKEDPLALLPADCNFVAHVNYGAILSQPAASTLVEEAWKEVAKSGVFERIKTEAGLEPKDLMDQVYVGLSLPMGPPAGKPVRTLLLQSKVPFDQTKMRAAFKDSSPERHKWQTYFKVKDVEGFSLAYMPTNRYLLFTEAPESTLQALIEASHSQPSISPDLVSLAQALDKQDAWVAAAVDENVRKDLQKPLPQGTNMPAGLVNGIRKAKAFGLGASLEGSRVKFLATVNCGDDSSAKQMSDGASHMFDQNKTMLNLTVMTFPKNTGALIKEAMQSLRFSSEGSFAHVSAQVGFQELKEQIMEAINTFGRPPAMPAGAGSRGGPPGGRRGGGRGGRGGGP